MIFETNCKELYTEQLHYSNVQAYRCILADTDRELAAVIYHCGLHENAELLEKFFVLLHLIVNERTRVSAHQKEGEE